MASILLVATDPVVESHIGQLAIAAGHQPVLDVTSGAAGEAIRRVRPAVAILDVALPPQVLEACVAAGREVGCGTVLTSSVAASDALAEEAAAVGASYFALSSGAAALGPIIDQAMRAARQPAVFDVPGLAAATGRRAGRETHATAQERETRLVGQPAEGFHREHRVR